MIYRTMGRTGYKVSALGLGGFQFTGRFGVSPEEADGIIDYALEKGVNIIDTAQGYGSGEGEAIVGRALLRHADNKPIVCAKVGHFHQGILMEVGADKLNGLYKNYNEILRTIKHSMWLLRIDHFDVLMMHEVEREWGVDFETGDSVVTTLLEDLKREGLTEYIGATSWDCAALAKMIKTGRIDTVMVAGGISLLTRVMFNELVPAAREQNVGITVGGCLGQNMPGLVVKNREALKHLYASEDEKIQILAEKFSRLYDLADELNLSMVQLAVRYVLSFEDIHSHTMGAREVAHIRDNINSVEMGPLPQEYIERIHAIQDLGETVGSLEMAKLQRQNKLF